MYFQIQSIAAFIILIRVKSIAIVFREQVKTFRLTLHLKRAGRLLHSFGVTAEVLKFIQLCNESARFELGRQLFPEASINRFT